MNGHNVAVECLSVDSAAFEFITISIYRVDRIVQHLGNPRGVLHAKPHQGQNTQIRVEFLVVLEFYLLVRLKEGVDIGHEIGIEM